eukprot:gene8249-9097_t
MQGKRLLAGPSSPLRQATAVHPLRRHPAQLSFDLFSSSYCEGVDGAVDGDRMSAVGRMAAGAKRWMMMQQQQRCPSFLLTCGGSLLLQLVLVFVFRVPAAVAAAAAGAATGKAKTSAASAAALATVSKPSTNKWMLLIKRLFLGVNAKNTYRSWRVGDTRSDVSALINGISMAVILGVWIGVAYVLQKKEQISETSRMKREVIRERQYRESMVIDAVKEIMRKLSDPKIKSSVKSDLTKQLKELDPNGKIRTFLEEGEKGQIDVSGVLGSTKDKPLKKATKKDNNGKASNKPPTTSESKKNGKGGSKTDREGDEEEEEGDDEAFYGKKSPSSTRKNGSSKSKSNGNGSKSGVGAEKRDSSLRGSDGKVGKGDEVSKLMAALENSLENVLEEDEITALVKSLRQRLQSMSSPEKQAAVMAKIAQKIGDEDYWREYVEQNL